MPALAATGIIRCATNRVFHIDPEYFTRIFQISGESWTLCPTMSGNRTPDLLAVCQNPSNSEGYQPEIRTQQKTVSSIISKADQITKAKISLDMEYLRIGTRYYKIVDALYPKGEGGHELVKQLELWSRGTIIHDHGREFLKTGVTKFDSADHLPADIRALYDHRKQVITKGYA